MGMAISSGHGHQQALWMALSDKSEDKVTVTLSLPWVVPCVTEEVGTEEARCEPCLRPGTMLGMLHSDSQNLCMFYWLETRGFENLNSTARRA